MKVEVRREPPRRAVLDVELPAEEVSRALAAAHRRLAQRVSIPGFRRGKAPRALVERYLGRESLIDEMLKALLPDGYARAVQEAGLRPVAQPEIDVRSEVVEDGAPLRFVATVDVVPDVDPGDYRAVRVPREEAVVRDEDVDARLTDLRLRHAVLSSAGDAPAARGDLVLVKVLAAAPGLPRLQAGKEYLVELGAGIHPEAIESALVGLTRSAEHTVPLGDGEEIRLAVVDVKRRVLPPLDDAFARQEGAESPAALRARERDRLAGEAAERAARAHEEAVLQAVTARASVEVPRSMVAHEVEHLLADLEESLRRRGLTLESYLRAAEKTEEGLRTEFAAIAEQRLRTQLVIDEIARREAVEPTEEEIAREVENLAQSLQQDAARMTEWLDAEGRRGALVRTLRRRKTVRWLVDLAGSPAEAGTA